MKMVNDILLLFAGVLCVGNAGVMLRNGESLGGVILIVVGLINLCLYDHSLRGAKGDR